MCRGEPAFVAKLRQASGIRRAETASTFASPRMPRNERLATGLPVGGTFTGSFRSDARELASISCMVSRRLRIGTLSRPRDTQTSMAFPLFLTRTNRKRFGGFKGRDANNFREIGTLTFRETAR